MGDIDYIWGLPSKKSKKEAGKYFRNVAFPGMVPAPKKEKSKKDSRRAFTKTQKGEILHQQDSKCAECHNKLDPRDIEYDHKKPWSSGGRTKTMNGRALCGSCHNKVTHGQILKKVEKRKSKANNTGVFGFPGVNNW